MPARSQRSSFRLAGAALCCASAALFPLGSSLAMPMTMNLAGTNWQVAYDDAQVTSLAFTPSTNDRGTLSFTEAFNGLTPIDIAFTQVVAASSNFGLRLFFNEVVQNNAGATISGLTLALADPTPSSPQGSAAHPGYAHFHPTNSAATGQLFGAFAAGGLSTDINAASAIALAGGTLATGASVDWANFGVHEWEDTGALRSFTLVETAAGVPPSNVPEPNALALLGVGLAGLLVLRLKAVQP